jgi:hypothetical protein
LKETSKEAEAGVPKEMLVLLQRLKIYKKMDKYERQIEINKSTSEQQRQVLT